MLPERSAGCVRSVSRSTATNSSVPPSAWQRTPRWIRAAPADFAAERGRMRKRIALQRVADLHEPVDRPFDYDRCAADIAHVDFDTIGVAIGAVVFAACVVWKARAFVAEKDHVRQLHRVLWCDERGRTSPHRPELRQPAHPKVIAR